MHRKPFAIVTDEAIIECSIAHVYEVAGLIVIFQMRQMIVLNPVNRRYHHHTVSMKLTEIQIKESI